MKQLKVLALAAIVVALAAPGAFAQSSDTETADAFANIIAAITLTNTADLNFGDIVQDATGGTVTVSPAGAIATTGNTLLGGHAAAAYTVTGDATQTFAVTLPASITIDDAGAGAPMTVDTFTASCTTGCVLTLGTASLTVGADLTVAASQVAGLYSGTFDVTVAYE